jgi:hypothetical protein
MSAKTETPTTEPSKFYCPENFFVVDPDAPALRDGVLGIQLQRIEFLLEAAHREYDEDQKLIGSTLLEVAQILVDQVAALVSHNETLKRQVKAAQAARV